MYKILLTGATGFVGGHLMKYLGELGYDVDTISRQEFMSEDWRRLDNFNLEETRPEDAYNPIKSYSTPHIVVHCAWPKLDLHKTDHLEFAELSCHFLEECKKRGIRVINLGSSSEYGVKYEPMREDMICEPINTYGIAKLAVTLFAKKLGFNTLRLFTVVGKGGHSFFDNKDTWKEWEYPKSNRAVIHQKLVCKAIERLMHAEHLFGEIINVGGEQERYGRGDLISLNDNDSKWLRVAQSQYEPSMWSCDYTKMKKLLNI